MLEKIGLPAKPSLRGNNWVVDASHCQGCSSQFTFINRKHHCRRCGGIFCNGCTQQRMILRGQGDSPVRICETCKKLEEASRFELRHGHRSRAGKGNSRSTAMNADELLVQTIGVDGKDSSSSSDKGMIYVVQGGTSRASSSSSQVSTTISQTIDEHSRAQNEAESVSPDVLRKQASDEKKKYKFLKGEGKSAEALQAFKSGKELERRAEALERYIKKNRKKALASSDLSEKENKDVVDDGIGRKSKLPRQAGNDKDDFASELRELGWSEIDQHDKDRRPESVSLEGELSSLMGEISKMKNTNGNYKSQVIFLKKKALTLKREGRLAEAKEELKKAKVLEKQLEEEELLGAAEESDDEISAIIRSIGGHEQEDIGIRYEQPENIDFEHLMRNTDPLNMDSTFDVTDEDMMDPELASVMTSLGWTEDPDSVENIVPQFSYADREALSREIHPKLDNPDKSSKLDTDEKVGIESIDEMDLGNAPSSRFMIQKELLGLKKKVLALTREGKVEEAEKELNKSKVLERQLEDMENASKMSTRQVGPSFQDKDGKITPNLGLKEDDGEISGYSERKKSNHVKTSGPSEIPAIYRVPPKARRRTKAEVQRELLGLKKKALALRRQGNPEEAEEVLEAAKVLETEMEEIEAPKVVVESYPPRPKKEVIESSHADAAGDEEGVTEQDMNDPALLSVLKNLGWTDAGLDSTIAEETSKNPVHDSSHSVSSYLPQSSSGTPSMVPSSTSTTGEMQRELLGLKRKALSCRRNGQTKEADELLKMAKELEARMQELTVSKVNPPEVAAGDKKLVRCDGLTHHGEPENSIFETRDNNSPRAGESIPSHMVVQSAISSEERASDPNFRSTEKLILAVSECVEGIGPLLEESSVSTSCVPQFPQPENLMDLLTGAGWTGSQGPTKKPEEWTGFDFDHSYPFIPSDRSEQVNSHEHPNKNELEAEKHVFVQGQHLHRSGSRDNEADYGKDMDSFRLEVLSLKRKAVALKREGKLAEAQAELRRAKLLEKSLVEDVHHQSKTGQGDVVLSVTVKESGTSDSVTKPSSGRDRFKLQQESLGHKRQALKLRREGRMQEAEAEFELAKALEAQLDKLAPHEPVQAESGDDVVSESLLDPQLLSALREIGLDTNDLVSLGSETGVEVEPSTSYVKEDNISQERIELEERIKAEKTKAVNLKRSGKQAEALGALRRAKLLEKKLQSLS